MASIKQKNERKFKITVCNGYHTDGRKICRSKTILVPEKIPKRRIPQYVTHEAEELERELRYGFSEDADTAFEVYAEKWLSHQTRYKPATLAGYRAMLQVCYSVIGGIRLRNIRPLIIEELAGKLRKREFRGETITEQTVHKYLNAVSVVLEDARRNGILQINVVRQCRFPKPVVESKQEIPTIAEMKRLLGCFLLEPLAYRVFDLLDTVTGCRRGELCALCWGSFQDGFVCISRSRSPVIGQGVLETDTKNHRVRHIMIPAGILDLLRELYLDRCSNIYDEKGCLISEGKPPKPEDYIFIDRMTGKPIHPDTFTHRLRRLYDRNGFSRRFHLHTLRHFLASFLLDNGISNKITADMLGHRDTGFLEHTYGHPLFEFERKATDCIGGLLNQQCFFVDDFPVEEDVDSDGKNLLLP